MEIKNKCNNKNEREVKTMGDKIDITKWWLFLVFLIILAMVIFGMINYTNLFVGTIIERKVFEQSYQKKEADKTALTTYKAQLSNLKSKLRNPELNENSRYEIEAQIESIEILIKGKED